MNAPLDSILFPQHLADLRRSGLSDEQIRRCGFRSSSDPAQIATWLGWKHQAKAIGPCLCIPFFRADGERLDYVRVKPDNPRKSKEGGKPIKYESPVRAANRAYFPPSTRAALTDACQALIVTEGEKKSAKADQEGFPCIGLVGVYGWMKGRPKNAEGKGEGPREMIPDIAAVVWRNRKVYIGFDSDLARNPNVRWAEWHLSEALRNAGAEVLALRIPSASDGSKQGLDDFLTAAGEDAFKELLAAAEPVQMPEARPSTTPEIVIGPAEYRVNAEACKALGTERDVYQRGGTLVHFVEQVEESDMAALVRRPVGSVGVRLLAKPLLRERLTRCASWMKLVRGQDGEASKVPAHPPGWSIDAVHARASWPAVRRLEAVVTHPVLLPDGTILSANGYDPASALLVCLPPGLEVNIPERPNRNDVAAAVAQLEDVLHDFPFETPEHKAAWFASLLTPLAWFAFTGPAPMFLVDGNVRGLGKGLLADVVAIIVTGRRFPVMSYTNDKEELRKKITTLAVEGERLVLLDNLAGAVGNDVLDMALTTDSWKDRLLGGNQVYNGSLNVTWFATGNNVQLAADTARRVCHIRMETSEERPEMKEGVRYPDLRAHVLGIRGTLLAAALTILRGWIVAGRPRHGLRSWGSFEQWSHTVREAVVFARLPDPGETRLQLQTMADRDANAMADIITGLAELDGAGRGKTTAEIVKLLKDDEPPSETKANMRAAVEELCGKLCGRLLGYKFRHFARRNFNGRMIDKAGESGKGTNRWIVVAANSVRDRPKTSPASPASPVSETPDSGDEGDEGDISTEEQAGELFGEADLSALWH